jgi:tetratricopeptide (TPR) repeat protein
LQDDKEGAIADCSKALEFNPDHMKALLRRAELYETSEKFDEALEDYTNAVERDPSLHVARAACMVNDYFFTNFYSIHLVRLPRQPPWVCRRI